MYSIQILILYIHLLTKRGQAEKFMTKLLENTILNLSNNETTAAALSQLEELLEENDYSGKALAFVLGKLVLTHGHMARLKTLANKFNFEIEVICTSAAQTQLAALNLGLTVSEKAPGDEILEEFKNSLSNINNDFSETPEQHTNESFETVKLPEIKEHYAIDNQIIEENQLNQPEVNEINECSTEIINESNSENIEDSCFNDVVEIENKDELIEQQQIELPFEDKKDFLKASKPEILKSKEEMTVMYIHQTLRSGQIIAHDGHVVITGDSHPGSEIIAGGDIIIWGTLGGIAHAGAGGNYQASIRALKMNAIQIRIADYIARRPDFKVNFSKEVSIKPEVARISNGEIKIFSLK